MLLAVDAGWGNYEKYINPVDCFSGYFSFFIDCLCGCPPSLKCTARWRQVQMSNVLLVESNARNQLAAIA